MMSAQYSRPVHTTPALRQLLYSSMSTTPTHCPLAVVLLLPSCLVVTSAVHPKHTDNQPARSDGQLAQQTGWRQPAGKHGCPTVWNSRQAKDRWQSGWDKTADNWWHSGCDDLRSGRGDRQAIEITGRENGGLAEQTLSTNYCC